MKQYGQEVIYHFSHQKGLKIIEPKMSTHGVPYVYAINDKALGMFFASNKSMGDFDGILSCDGNQKGSFYEAYPDAFKSRFEGVEGTMYVLPKSYFVHKQEMWLPEWVSERTVPVLDEIHIPDLYTAILQQAELGNINIYYYKDYDQGMKLKLRQHIKSRLIEFKILERENRAKTFCEKMYPDIVAEVLQETSANKD